MPDAGRLLAAYDAQLRTDAEVANAQSAEQLGPLWLARYPGGRALVIYGADAAPRTAALVGAALDRLDDCTEIEWKTRGHDRAPGLDGALRAHGFVPEEPESIMVGPLEALTEPVPLPDGVTLRRVTAEADVRAMTAMAEEAFGHSAGSRHADTLLERMAEGQPLQLWVAEQEGRIVSCGRLEPVPGTEFVGLWGGATLPAHRHRGIYRALTAARAEAALADGYRFVHSDSTEFSRPVLERSGLVKVSTTTPYVRRVTPRRTHP